MNRFSIGIQIGIGFVVAIALMLGSVVLNVSQLNVMSAKSDDVTLLSKLDVGIHTYLEALVDEETGMRAYVASTKPGFLDPFKGGRAAEPGIFSELTTDAAGSAVLNRAVSAAGQDAKRVDDFFDHEIALVQAGRQKEAVGHLGEGKDAFDAFRADLATARTEIEHQKEAALLAFASAQKTQLTSMTVVAFASVVILIGLAFFLGRSIATRLGRVTAGLRTIVEEDLVRLLRAYDELAKGNLRAQFSSNPPSIDQAGSDEIAGLAKSYNALSRGLTQSGEKFSATTQNLLKTMHEVAEAADVVRTSAGEISSGNGDLSQRTEEQASSLEETAASMEELTATVHQNAENAKQANQLVIGASAIATKGGIVVGEVVQTMAAINDAGKKIVDIISVIDGIAFQTNILALNAAVEAARAGEQGRGFAVVAGEVRTLAQRSAAAAKEIKQLIGDSVEKTDAGTRLVGQAGDTMAEIVASVNRVTEIMSAIASASLQQGNGIGQVNEAVTQLDKTTQQNAALVEEIAASARVLDERSRGLVELVGAFSFTQGDVRPAPRPSAPRPAAPRAVPTPRKLRKSGGSVAVAVRPATSAPAQDREDDWSSF